MPKPVKEKVIVSHALTGLVIKATLPQTVTVIVERLKLHPLYHKAIKQSKKYLVHDQLGVKEGDLVEIVQTKPVSAKKRFKVLRVIGQDIASIVSEELKAEAAEAIAEVLPDKSEDQSVSETGVPAPTEKPISSDLSEKPKKSRVKKEAK